VLKKEPATRGKKKTLWRQKEAGKLYHLTQGKAFFGKGKQINPWGRTGEGRDEEGVERSRGGLADRTSYPKCFCSSFFRWGKAKINQNNLVEGGEGLWKGGQMKKPRRTLSHLVGKVKKLKRTGGKNS